jgi:hypothetical protein
VKVGDCIRRAVEVTCGFPGHLILYSLIAYPLDKVFKLTRTRGVARVKHSSDFIDLLTFGVDFDRARAKFELVGVRWLVIGIEEGDMEDGVNFHRGREVETVGVGSDTFEDLEWSGSTNV